MTQNQALKPTMTSFELAALAANAAESKKAVETMVLETGKVSYLADYFVICSGESAAQIRTIAEEIGRLFKQQGQEPLGRERDQSNRWYLLDYGDVVIHVMNRHERQYYQIEHFWNHADVVAPQKWRQAIPQAS